MAATGEMPQFSHALGPKWTMQLDPTRSDGQAQTSVDILYRNKLVDVVEGGKGKGEGEGEWPIYAVLSNGEKIGADYVISCIGVAPNTSWLEGCDFDIAEDGGLRVDETMQTSVPDVYAAGDVCTLSEAITGPQFFQIRLWSQARMTAEFAAHCMVNTKEAEFLDLGFDLFTHITYFFGRKVILLGLYDGQGLGDEPEDDVVLYSRATEDTFARVLLLRGRMQGAVLVGETDLEEVCENLILSGIDLSSYGPELLDPEVELEDYFD
eukprot:CAMPEP_0197497618 /NCGR_PEP_ID=MMETSP1311-20131121/52479_1 /TAXON_ID=464262 /ORGANISM="Genus nov. species nov., Strain RCC856" /LENGTH=265 /DNA_ID=CAMNT_0043043291 /DNA_START=52 /DNA_END=849 /DNA_ORIENTATION=-